METPSAKKRKYKPRIRWKDAHEEILVNVWKTHIDDLQSNRVNQAQCLDSMKALQQIGFSISVHDVRAKLINMTSKYRREKRRMIASGARISDWGIYEQLDILMKKLEEKRQYFDKELNSKSPPTVAITTFSNSDSDAALGLSSPISAISISAPMPKSSTLLEAANGEVTNFQQDLLNGLKKLENVMLTQADEQKKAFDQLLALELKNTNLLKFIASNLLEMKDAMTKFSEKLD